MSDINLVIRPTKEHQLRLGVAIGFALALTWSSVVDTANAQVVQAAGENKAEMLGVSAQLAAGESGRFSSRRMLVQFPQTGEKSPSDAKRATDVKDEKTLPDDKKDDIVTEVKPDTSESNVKTDQGGGITPVQSSGLKLGVDRVNISTKKIGTGLLPEDTAAKLAAPSMPLLDGQSRGIVAQQVSWRPAAICHLPLYFEDAMLERHGHVRWGCAQPLVSGVKFFGTVPLLPYITTLQPQFHYRYTLGHFRPGSCAPALKDHLPWDQRAATVEVLSLGAFFWAAPL